MILVELYVPSLGESYNISLNEHQKAGTAPEELLELVRKKNAEAERGAAGYDLFAVPGGERLKKNLPLTAQGIRDGAKLVLA